jgi:hypothetical protein
MSAARLRSSRGVRDRMRVIKRSLEATGRAAA